MTDKPRLQVAVVSDYICPFCYIGFLRLEKLRPDYDLTVNWAMLEIHPDTPAEGKPVEALGYSRPQLDSLLENLDSLAQEEGVRLAAHSYTTSSHRALLLAEAGKRLGAAVFYRLHRRLFETFLVEGRNIGDPTVLEALAHECGVPPATLEDAWSNPEYEQRLQRNLAAAVHNGVTGTPTFFIGEQRLTGAVPVEALRRAARAAAETPPG